MFSCINIDLGMRAMQIPKLVWDHFRHVALAQAWSTAVIWCTASPVFQGYSSTAWLMITVTGCILLLLVCPMYSGRWQQSVQMQCSHIAHALGVAIWSEWIPRHLVYSDCSGLCAEPSMFWPAEYASLLPMARSLGPVRACQPDFSQPIEKILLIKQASVNTKGGIIGYAWNHRNRAILVFINSLCKFYACLPQIMWSLTISVKAWCSVRVSLYVFP